MTSHKLYHQTYFQINSLLVTFSVDCVSLYEYLYLSSTESKHFFEKVILDSFSIDSEFELT